VCLIIIKFRGGWELSIVGKNLSLEANYAHILPLIQRFLIRNLPHQVALWHRGQSYPVMQMNALRNYSRF